MKEIAQRYGVRDAGAIAEAFTAAKELPCRPGSSIWRGSIKLRGASRRPSWTYPNGSARFMNAMRNCPDPKICSP